MFELVQAKLIDGPEQQQERNRTEREKPGSLVPGRSNGEVQKCASLVPHTIVVARDHAKAIVAWPKIGVKCLAPRSRVLPALIATLKPVTKAHLLRCHETKRGVVDLQIAHARRQGYIRICIGVHVVAFVVGDDLLDVHWWWKLVKDKMARIDGLIGKPHPPIRRFRGRIKGTYVAQGSV